MRGSSAAVSNRFLSKVKVNHGQSHEEEDGRPRRLKLKPFATV